MAGGKTVKNSHQTKLDKYARPKETGTEESYGAQQESPGQTNVPIETPTLQDIMTAIKDVKHVLENKIDSTAIEVTLIRTNLHKITDRVKATEESVLTLTSTTDRLGKHVKQLQTKMDQMAAQLDDHEGRSRRNNIRITGVPEKAEGPSTDLFVEDLITQGLQPRGLSKFFGVERAHRVPGKRPPPGAPPRTIIARIFNFRDRDIILQEARVAPPVTYQNTNIGLFPDFTMQVQKLRRTFTELKKELRSQNIRYAMLFPAKLRIADGTKTHFFLTPEEGWTWLEKRKESQHTALRGRSSPVVSPNKKGSDNTNTNEQAPTSPSGLAPAQTDWFDAPNG